MKRDRKPPPVGLAVERSPIAGVDKAGAADGWGAFWLLGAKASGSSVAGGPRPVPSKVELSSSGWDESSAVGKGKPFWRYIWLAGMVLKAKTDGDMSEPGLKRIRYCEATPKASSMVDRGDEIKLAAPAPPPAAPMPMALAGIGLAESASTGDWPASGGADVGEEEEEEEEEGDTGPSLAEVDEPNEELGEADWPLGGVGGLG